MSQPSRGLVLAPDNTLWYMEVRRKLSYFGRDYPLQSWSWLRAFVRVRYGAGSQALSARTVETITKPGYHADGDGLYLVVDKSGARRWAFIYHSQGKRREMGLGRMGLKEARERADEVRRQIRAGHRSDPARRSNRDKKAAIPTFEAISREVIADAQARSANDKVRYQWELLLGPSYCASILQKPVNEITTLDVERICGPSGAASPRPAASSSSACGVCSTMPGSTCGIGTGS